MILSAKHCRERAEYNKNAVNLDGRGLVETLTKSILKSADRGKFQAVFRKKILVKMCGTPGSYQRLLQKFRKQGFTILFTKPECDAVIIKW